jgi:FixJ family two-component response regulator
MADSGAAALGQRAVVTASAIIRLVAPRNLALAGAMTVHIVEDDPGVRDALSELCRSVGRRVRLYQDCQSFGAGENVRGSDVVLVDLGLPDGRGTKVIRSARALANPPRIVVISGLPIGEIAASLKDFADIAVVRKPLTPDLISLLL